MEAPFSHISLAHVSTPLFTPCWFSVGRRAAVRDVGVKFLTLLNEFPRKGGRGQKRGEIQARFQFPISASSPSALSQMYRGKKAGKGGRPGETGGNEDDSQDRQNFEKGRKERRRPTASFFLPLRQPAAPLNPKSKAN